MFLSKFHYNSAKLLWLEHIQITCDLRPDVWYSGKTSECLLSTTWMICKHIWCQILFLHNFSIRSAVAWILKSFSYFFHSFPPLKGERKTWSWGASKGLFECVSCCAWEMNKLKPCKRLLVTLPSQADRCAHYFAWLCSSILCQTQEGSGKSIAAAWDISRVFWWTTNFSPH